MSKLTDRQIINVRPTGKVVRLQDGRGLYLEITVAGSKVWRFRYQLKGRENRLSIGPYPEISLAEARAERDRLKGLCKRGLDPVLHRREAMAEEQARAENTFKHVALEYFSVRAAEWTPKTRSVLMSRAERYLFPWIGDRPIGEITPPELLQVLRRHESTGAATIAAKCKRLASQVSRFGIASGRCERDPAQDLTGALKPVVLRNHPAITDAKTLGEFLRSVDTGFKGSFTVHCALKLLPLLLLRPGELRRLEWSEIDFEEALIRLPAEKLKMRRDHLVPLPRQAVAILQDIRPLSGHGRPVFPNYRRPQEPLGEGALIGAIRRLGWPPEQVSAHGFRTTASTLLHEQGWRSELIEKQLAHEDRNQVRGTYNKAQYLPERREMLQSWADYLDALRAGSGVEKGA